MASKSTLTYQSYCDDCDRFGVTNPYPDEASFNRAYGIVEPVEPPIIITPKSRNHPMIDTDESIKQSDFSKSEHYFDALEAQQILDHIRRTG